MKPGQRRPQVTRLDQGAAGRVVPVVPEARNVGLGEGQDVVPVMTNVETEDRVVLKMIVVLRPLRMANRRNWAMSCHRLCGTKFH